MILAFLPNLWNRATGLILVVLLCLGLWLKDKVWPWWKERRGRPTDRERPTALRAGSTTPRWGRVSAKRKRSRPEGIAQTAGHPLVRTAIGKSRRRPMKKVFGFVLVLSLFALAGCGYMVSDDEAIQAAHNAGLTDVTVLSSHKLSPHMMGGCGEDDSAAFKISATNPAGTKVNATVCCGAVLKGCTIRY